MRNPWFLFRFLCALCDYTKLSIFSLQILSVTSCDFFTQGVSHPQFTIFYLRFTIVFLCALCALCGQFLVGQLPFTNYHSLSIQGSFPLLGAGRLTPQNIHPPSVWRIYPPPANPKPKIPPDPRPLTTTPHPPSAIRLLTPSLRAKNKITKICVISEICG